MHAFEIATVKARLVEAGGGYEVVHNSAGLEIGVYVLVAPEPDRQQPHEDDELYVVLEGTGILDVEGVQAPVREGTAVFVEAGAEHRFSAYEHLSVLVIFERKACGKPVGLYRNPPDAGEARTGQPQRTTTEEDPMNRLMIVARLNEGAHDEAEALIRKGPPFEPGELGFHRHGAYLTAGEVVFLFEAPEVEWIVNDIVDNPIIASAFGPWHQLIEGTPRLAHERFYWSREEKNVGLGLGT